MYGRSVKDLATNVGGMDKIGYTIYQAAILFRLSNTHDGDVKWN
jgi:hypothetical protein